MNDKMAIFAVFLSVLDHSAQSKKTENEKTHQSDDQKLSDGNRYEPVKTGKPMEGGEGKC